MEPRKGPVRGRFRSESTAGAVVDGEGPRGAMGEEGNQFRAGEGKW